MTEASSDRQRRYERTPKKRVILTPLDGELLACLAGSKYLTTHHLAAVSGWTEKKVRNHARKLFNAGLVDNVPVDLVTLTGSLYGSAPNVYALTEKGAAWLVAHGYAAEPPRVPDVSRQSYTFLSHELLVSDVRAWACRAARGRGYRLEVWREGPEAALPPVRPDAWLVLPVAEQGEKTIRLVGIVEADRGTEREAVWQKKAADYGTLFASPEGLKPTGYQAARVLVVCPGPERRDRVAAWLAGTLVKNRVWVASKDALEADLTAPVWRRPGADSLHALVL